MFAMERGEEDTLRFSQKCEICRCSMW